MFFTKKKQTCDLSNICQLNRDAVSKDKYESLKKKFDVITELLRLNQQEFFNILNKVQNECFLEDFYENTAHLCCKLKPDYIKYKLVFNYYNGQYSIAWRVQDERTNCFVQTHKIYVDEETYLYYRKKILDWEQYLITAKTTTIALSHFIPK